MLSALIIFYCIIAFALIVLVMLQDPKGDGAIFGGGGGSQGVFGATGAASFIVKATRFIAVLFAVCVIGLNFMLMRSNSSSAVFDNETEIKAPVLETKAPQETAPAPKATETPETKAENK